MFEKNQILYMTFQCTDVYGCPKFLDMICMTSGCIRAESFIAKEYAFAHCMHDNGPHMSSHALDLTEIVKLWSLNKNV